MSRDSPTRPSVDLFEPRQSIWTIIEGNAIEEERTEIKKLIGSSLIEETVDLHREVNTLFDIWRDFREETDKLGKGSSLPEPPNVRENLVKQIQLFVKLIQEKSAREKSCLRGLSPYQSDVVSNICEAKDQQSIPPERPQTARSAKDGRETPLRPNTSSGNGSACGSRSSCYFSDSQEVRSSEEIEKLADVIRDDLEEERNGLNSDIEFLQQCLMDESMFQASFSTKSEPSLKELKDIGLKLEKELLIADTVPKDNVRKYAPNQQSQDKYKVRQPRQRHSPEAGASAMLPSPPSSAPTSRTRTSMIQRKQLATKVMQFTSDERFYGKQQVVQGDKIKHRQPYQSELSDGKSGKKQITAIAPTTTVITPCAVSSIGSNSRKLRQVVLNSREHQT